MSKLWSSLVSKSDAGTVLSVIGILVSIAVAILNHYATRGDLTYSLTEYTLPLQNEYRKSYQIEVRNSGNVLIKTVMAIAALTEGRIVGDPVAFARPGLNQQVKSKKGDILNYEVDVPVLNPGENFSVSLQASFRNEFASPQFVVRGEGFAGKLVRPGTPPLVLDGFYALVLIFVVQTLWDLFKK